MDLWEAIDKYRICQQAMPRSNLEHCDTCPLDAGALVMGGMDYAGCDLLWMVDKSLEGGECFED